MIYNLFSSKASMIQVCRERSVLSGSSSPHCWWKRQKCVKFKLSSYSATVSICDSNLDIRAQLKAAHSSGS